ncbi:MAG TPA: hypothetical protein GX532_06845 [Clostridia bacterium]|jgi:hypothetical protein|nr:hypothetical protein [Clostridia bacterium]
MDEKKLNSLYEERSRLLDAWSLANKNHKMSILTRIGDIDEQIAIIKENVAHLTAKKTKLRPEF